MFSSYSSRNILKFLVLLVLTMFLTLWSSVPICSAKKNWQTRGDRWLERNYREWQRLSPEEKEILRKRLKHFESLPLQKKELIKKHYERWKQLSPEQRRLIKEYLNNWDKLTPEEKNLIKRQFQREFGY